MKVAGSVQQNKSPHSEQQTGIEQQKAQSKKAQADKEQKITQQATSKKAKLAAKRQRYEKAMMKLKLEQQQIDEQQAWAAGGDNDAATADDEI